MPTKLLVIISRIGDNLECDLSLIEARVTIRRALCLTARLCHEFFIPSEASNAGNILARTSEDPLTKITKATATKLTAQQLKRPENH
jgi:hypothetical protein